MAAYSRFAVAIAFLTMTLCDSSFAQSLNYGDALNKCILFYEGQRSGPLNAATQRNNWRNDSGLTDGFAEGVNLLGGYYDAGDNIKFGFPMAFTITTLAWSAVEYSSYLLKAGQLGYLKDAIKWGTDYFIKAHSAPYVLYGQVGTGTSDHSCWERPEDMDTSRTAFAITAQNPGSELAGETSAAMAAASMVFKASNPTYAATLLSHAKQLFTFADTYRGDYTTAITDALEYYKSWSGYKDELVWAAAWLYRATRDQTFLSYLMANDASLKASASTDEFFSWDNKIAGYHVMLAKMLLYKAYNTSNTAQTDFLTKFKVKADEYICKILPDSPLRTVSFTPEGMFFFVPRSSQYALNAAFLASAYSDYLAHANQQLTCGGTTYLPAAIFSFAKRQMDYLLGSNSAGRSYMLGFGSNFPQFVHHRGASIVSINVDRKFVGCGQGYSEWYASKSPNPNVHVGAIVGGPAADDSFVDDRTDSAQTEPATYYNSAAVGVLAKLTATC